MERRIFRDEKKFMSLSLIAAVMFVGVVTVCAYANGVINVTASTVIIEDYKASKANLLSTITSNGYGAGTLGTYIRAYLKTNNTYVQRLGFEQEIGDAGYITTRRGYVGIGDLGLLYEGVVWEKF